MHTQTDTTKRIVARSSGKVHVVQGNRTACGLVLGSMMYEWVAPTEWVTCWFCRDV